MARPRRTQQNEAQVREQEMVAMKAAENMPKGDSTEEGISDEQFHEDFIATALSQGHSLEVAEGLYLEALAEMESSAAKNLVEEVEETSPAEHREFSNSRVNDAVNDGGPYTEGEEEMKPTIEEIIRTRMGGGGQRPAVPGDNSDKGNVLMDIIRSRTNAHEQQSVADVISMRTQGRKSNKTVQQIIFERKFGKGRI